MPGSRCSAVFWPLPRDDYGEARAHYERAEAAYPGYWLVAGISAELLGAEGRYAEAIEILEANLASTTARTCSRRSASYTRSRVESDRARYWQQKALARLSAIGATRRGALLSPPRGLLRRRGKGRRRSRHLGARRSAAAGEFLDAGGTRLGALPKRPVR